MKKSQEELMDLMEKEIKLLKKLNRQKGEIIHRCKRRIQELEEEVGTLELELESGFDDLEQALWNTESELADMRTKRFNPLFSEN